MVPLLPRLVFVKRSCACFKFHHRAMSILGSPLPGQCADHQPVYLSVIPAQLRYLLRNVPTIPGHIQADAPMWSRPWKRVVGAHHAIHHGEISRIIFFSYYVCFVTSFFETRKLTQQNCTQLLTPLLGL